MARLRLALAQINCTMGDIGGNCRKIAAFMAQAKEQQADLVVFPELAISGYPPEDLLFKKSFIHSNLTALNDLKPHTRGLNAVVGFVDDRQGVYNAAAVMADGELRGVYRKICLPNYGVFDEKRYFKEGKQALVAVFGEIRVGMSICEDLWLPEGPIWSLVNQGGAELILVINASPYHMGKWKQRQEIIKTQAQEHGVTIAYCNMVGSQDELIFDGHSMVYDQQGELIAQGYQFQEDLVILDIESNGKLIRSSSAHPAVTKYEVVSIELSPPQACPPAPLPVSPLHPLLSHLEEIYQALLLGIRDYTRKNGFSQVLIALSGGVDSALTLTLAVDALGKENVKAIFMPSRYSSAASAEDSRQLAHNLGVDLLEIPIQSTFENYLQQLAPHFKGLASGIAEENLQARIRGNLLMALSNKFGWLVLTTGNKSETSVGYATLYGDMAGGFAVIKDVSKTLVYKLAEHRNTSRPPAVIPRRILEKEPSAELAENQKDSDALPPYHELDPILIAYVEEEKGADEIIKMGYPAQTVKQVIEMIDRSEYKRRQAPVGIKITPKAFGKDRRLPITNRFRP